MIPYGKQSISEEDIRAVVDVLRSDFLTCGPKVDEFEEAFAEMCGAKYAVACCNGTAALHLAMLAAEIGPGDRVVTSPITFLASANCAAYVGAIPDFSDIDPTSYCLSPDALEENWKEDTKAVVAVDFAGQPAEMPRIAEISRSRGAVVIEDACHAVGGKLWFKDNEYTIGGHPWADMTTFSFHPVKTMTTGEGGMVVTDNKVYAERMRCLRGHGMVREAERFISFGKPDCSIKEEQVGQLYEMQSLGYNFRLSDIHAALGLSQLGRMSSFIARRAEIVAEYNRKFAELEGVTLPKLAPWLAGFASEQKLSWHLYALRIDWQRSGLTRPRAMHQLRSIGVGTQVHYLPVHLQPYYTQRWETPELPEAESFSGEVLSLPLYPEMTDEDVELVSSSVSELLR